MDIASRIKSVRGNMSQDEFARKLGVHKNSLGRYERGDSTPDVDVAEKICLVFGVSSQWLLLGIGPMRAGEAAGECTSIVNSPEIANLERRIAELDAENKRLQVELIAEKRITDMCQTVLKALQSMAPKVGFTRTDAPVSAPSAPLTHLTNDE